MIPLVLLMLASGGNQSVRAMLDGAMDDFRAGRIEQSLSGFDRVAQLSPADAPYLWQRGIAQYYAGKFRDWPPLSCSAAPDLRWPASG
jgi:hypothetical protein